MSGHIYAKIPDDLWVEMRDLKVDLNVKSWDKMIDYICDIVERPRMKKDYNPYYPNGKMRFINLEVTPNTEKKFKKFSHVFKGFWHALDYLVENTKMKRKSFI